MGNEENDDLLVEVTDSEDEIFEKEEIDYYIEKKIFDFIQNEKSNPKSTKKTLIFIVTSLFTFLSSSVLIIALPIYMKYTSVNNISTYSKLVTLSFINGILFITVHLIGIFSKCGSQTCTRYNLCLVEVLKVSLLLSVGNVLVFWLTDGSYVSCHLKDPLKGCSIVFSFLFYFVFSRKKMSLERTFCAITIVVGVFVSVDFGVCDKFQCNGNSNLTEITPKFHFLYVILYMLAIGIWVLHFTLIEVSWTTLKGSNSNSNVSVLSNISSSLNTGSENSKASIQSLSIICQEEQEEQVNLKKENSSKKSSKSIFSSKFQNNKTKSGRKLDNSVSCSASQRNQLSVPVVKKFPVTSTPNNEVAGWNSWTSGQCYDVALWQHLTCCLVVLGLCWVPTLSIFKNGKEKLLVDVMTETVTSFWCHLGWDNSVKCNYLPLFTSLVSVSYVVLMLSSIELLKNAQSALTVVSIMMAALPVAGLFWSMFSLNADAASVIEFNPEISGEAVCAVLGFPIVGIGIVLLMKSHLREFRLIV